MDSNAKVIEYKDNAGDHRIKVVAGNGKTTSASSEGYKNLVDARQTEINSSIIKLHHYKKTLSAKQLEAINELTKPE